MGEEGKELKNAHEPKHQNISALQEPRTNTKLAKTCMGREWVDRERHGGEGEPATQEEGRAAMAGKKVKGSRVSFLAQFQVLNAWTSPGHLAWLYLIAHYGLPIIFGVLPLL